MINQQLKAVSPRTHFQFGLCVFLLKNKHFTISGQDVEGAPLCHHINDIVKSGTVSDELVVQIVDGQNLSVRWKALPAAKLCPDQKSDTNSQYTDTEILVSCY